jgi:hypothetical protein
MTDKLFIWGFTLAGALALNYSMFVIECLNKWQAGLSIMLASIVMLITACIELHKL